MKCPHCGYEHARHVDGPKGPFYQLPVNATRITSGLGQSSRASVWGCPGCMKTFLSTEW